MIKRIVAFLLIGCTLCISGCSAKSQSAANRAENENKLYLIAGLDDAAQNADVIFTVAYDANACEMRVAQIPRDTYLRCESPQNKINQLYSAKLAAGASEEEAFSVFASALERQFGMRLDGYLAVKLDVFRRIVDMLGGVDIELSRDMTLTIDTDRTLVLKAGMNHIDGNAAECFIRYRSGYAMGDIGRLDAQKLFLSALFAKLKNGLTLPAVYELSSIIKNDAITDVRFPTDVFPLLDTVRDGQKKTVVFATVPGEPAFGENGVSFYILNRKSAAEMAKKYMFAFREFDPDRSFTNKSIDSFANIYGDGTIKIREYSGEDIRDMTITIKDQ